MEENEKKSWLKKLRKRRALQLFATFVKSAAVGLLFAVICFVYDVYHDSEQDKQLDASIDQLKKIEQSLSTRYLGIFPEYIQEIDVLFNNLDPTDTVVIFEDVLYYGIKSRPLEFRNVNEKLFKHLINGGLVTVAYYDYKETNGKSMSNIFNKMIMESRISSHYLSALYIKRSDTLEYLRRLGLYGNDVLEGVDSALCERYFSASRRDNPVKFWQDVEAYAKNNLVGENWMKPNATPSELVVDQMCAELDMVKQELLGQEKDPEDILFDDYMKMYRSMSEVIAKYYGKYGAVLVPMDEYLTMSCWLVKKGNQKGIGSVLAFPSKYSTDEIGFYSQDEAFSRYISTMLEGVKDNQKSRSSN